MVGRVVEIATDGRHLSMFRGFLVVNERGEEVGRVPIDDVAAVIANAPASHIRTMFLSSYPTEGYPSSYAVPITCPPLSFGPLTAACGEVLPLRGHAAGTDFRHRTARERVWADEQQVKLAVSRRVQIGHDGK